MEITRDDIETVAGPAERFTGQVFLDTIAVPSDQSRVNVSNVHTSRRARERRGTPIRTARRSM
jgi:hypothetical protein